MAVGAQLSVTDLRRAARHPVDYPIVAEHRTKGDIDLRLTNLSAHGFMIDDAPPLARGDRVIVRLPVIGRIEAYCMWIAGGRAGFQFERVVRLGDFAAMVEQLRPRVRSQIPARRRD